ncbi:cupin domain-containing protein [Mesorhizobium sp. B2-4-15]|uniref:cupin domain-containing protein n=1 Tax=Mesorhizobium sp. B2-4-15 TaxID=2589934 RepID=UPI0015EED10B|nr:cupin domain-containing protein [Mesorhizobium sp. B2-4-15]
MGVTVETYFFKGNGRVPNSRLPLLVYRDVVAWSAIEMEDRQRSNYWNPSWHSPIGFYPQHHFHSQSHELIAVIRGEARGLFGGHDGKEVLLRKGDVVAIPAGVGHFGVSITDDLLVTGSFPAGFGVLDFRLGHPDEYYELAETSRRVPIPAFDPFFGPGGPLPTLWSDADNGKSVPVTWTV